MTYDDLTSQYGQVIRPADLDGLTETELERIRYRGRTNLFWLCNRILRQPNEDSFSPLHEAMCEQGFPKCNPRRPFAEWDKEIKNWLVLCFRGSCKSTIARSWVAQAFLCDPDLSVLVFSATQALAGRIVYAIHHPFRYNEVFRKLYPKYAEVAKKRANGEEDSFTLKARGAFDPNPSCASCSLESASVGAHPDVLLLDDLFSDEAEYSDERLQALIQKFDVLDPLVNPGGYTVTLTTRQGLDDLADHIWESGIEFENTSRLVIPVWELKTDGTPEEIEARKQRQRFGRLKESDVILAWPEKVDWAFLEPQYRTKPKLFARNYLLDVEAETDRVAIFSADFVAKAAYPNEQIDKRFTVQNSRRFANFDLAGLSGDPKSDATVGVVYDINEKGQFAFRFGSIGRYRSSRELATAIVQLCELHRPERIRIEDAIASRYLEGEIYAVARELLKGKSYQLEGTFAMPPVWDEKEKQWVETPPAKTRLDFVLPDRVRNAKTNRISNLHPAMENGSVVLATNLLVQHEELCKQFLRWDGATRPRRKDDFLDAMASGHEHRPYVDWTLWSIAESRKVPEFAPDGPSVFRHYDGLRSAQRQEDLMADEMRRILHPYER